MGHALEEQTLIEKLRALPPEKAAEVVDFVDFLCQRDTDRHLVIRERDRLVAAVNQGLADSEAGRLIDDEDLDAVLDAEFGPLT